MMNLCIGCGDDLSPETHPLQECPCGEWRCGHCLLDSARHQKHRADDLERRLRLAHAMLRRLEWQHHDSDEHPAYTECVLCKQKPHAADCELAALLARLAGTDGLAS